jgi:uncharacterized protein YjgD (DUF1641 family)
MAKPIRALPSPTEDEGTASLSEALASELNSAGGSLRELLELVRLLDERGWLRFASDLLRAEDRVVAVVTDRVDPADIKRVAQNLELMYRTLRSVDPKLFAEFMNGVPGGVKEARRARSDSTLGFLEIVGALRDPEVNLGVRMMLGFLRGIGQSARE